MKKLIFPLMACTVLLLSGYARCPGFIRTIMLSGVDSRIRSDVSDVVEDFKHRTIDQATIFALIAAIREVYRANCLLDRLEAVRVKVKDDRIFVTVYHDRQHQPEVITRP